MTLDQKNEQRAALKLETFARREVLRRIEHPLKLLKVAVDKETAKAEERMERNRQYKTIEDIQDAYAYEEITDEERYALTKALEDGEEYISNTMTPLRAALGILRDFAGRISREADDLEFGLLSPEEQERRRKAADERMEAMLARRAARRGELGGENSERDHEGDPAAEL